MGVELVVVLVGSLGIGAAWWTLASSSHRSLRSVLSHWSAVSCHWTSKIILASVSREGSTWCMGASLADMMVIRGLRSSDLLSEQCWVGCMSLDQESCSGRLS